jgi:hypothetical protein
MATVVLFRDVTRSIACIQPAQYCQKFLNGPVLLFTPYVVQLNVSSDAFAHFTEIRNGVESQLPPETFDDLILLMRKFASNSLTPSLASPRDVPRHEENVHDFLQEFDRENRGTTIKADFQSNRDSFTVMQRPSHRPHKDSTESLKEFSRNR